MSAITTVKFRMYNTGSVGDCLLLLFMKGNVISFRMLVDCGGWSTNTALVTPCVEDIKKTCGGELDLLVMTHQHKDHVSGFNQARKVFDQIAVKQVWMSWIEDPKDAIAMKVKAKYGKKIKAAIKQVADVKQKLEKMASHKYLVTTTGKRMERKAARANQALDLLYFEEGMNYGKGAAKGAQSNQDAVDYVRKKGKTLTYWKPGEVAKNIPGADGIKFFMLGPPRDADMKLFFTVTENQKEIYKLAASSPSVREEDLPESVFIGNSGIKLQNLISPFHQRFALQGQALKEWNKKYNNDAMKWRQIETDSDEAALGIALEANKYTNNTSFAMAIELGSSGRVILLPGDAQSGNWMGWHKPDVMQSLRNKGGKDTNELLRDTVFYKVGHHSSKNGTAAVSGLDKMTSPDLVACIPLIKAEIPVAWIPSGFPAKPLYKMLIQKTNGRMVRTDEGVVQDARAKKLRDGLSANDLKAFEKSYSKGTCYHELIINAE